MSLHYSGLIICSLCVGKGCQWRQEVVPKVAQLKQRLMLLPDTQTLETPQLSRLMVVILFRTEPNLLITGSWTGVIYLFCFHSWVKPRKAAQPWEIGRSIIISSRGGWGLSSWALSTVIVVKCRQIGMSARQAQADWRASRMSMGPWDTGDDGGKSVCHSRSLFCGQSPSFSTYRCYCDHFLEGEQTLRM